MPQGVTFSRKNSFSFCQTEERTQGKRWKQDSIGKDQGWMFRRFTPTQDDEKNKPPNRPTESPTMGPMQHSSHGLTCRKSVS